MNYEEIGKIMNLLIQGQDFFKRECKDLIQQYNDQLIKQPSLEYEITNQFNNEIKELIKIELNKNFTPSDESVKIVLDGLDIKQYLGF